MKRFDDLPPERMQVDVQSREQSEKRRPEGACLAQVSAISGAYFVPVSFVAKDWNVTPRRIRALLAAGRLAGQVQVNGYWEVRYPYLFAFGTRGPSLKRQERPPKRSKQTPKKGELYAV